MAKRGVALLGCAVVVMTTLPRFKAWAQVAEFQVRAQEGTLRIPLLIRSRRCSDHIDYHQVMFLIEACCSMLLQGEDKNQQRGTPTPTSRSCTSTYCIRRLPPPTLLFFRGYGAKCDVFVHGNRCTSFASWSQHQAQRLSTSRGGRTAERDRGRDEPTWDLDGECLPFILYVLL